MRRTFTVLCIASLVWALTGCAFSANKVRDEEAGLIGAPDAVEGRLYGRLLNWQDAFSNKAEAQRWFDSICMQYDRVAVRVASQWKEYDKAVQSYRQISRPSREDQDSLLQVKNDLVDAILNYTPINEEVNKYLARGVSLQYSYSGPFYGGRRYSDEMVKSAVDNLNAGYKKMTSTIY
jgi:hypothetical protein